MLLVPPLANVSCNLYVFFFNDTAAPEIYTLSLHDALPILCEVQGRRQHLLPLRPPGIATRLPDGRILADGAQEFDRSEEHTSELQSHSDLVCRLLLEKKNKTKETVPKPFRTPATYMS